MSSPGQLQRSIPVPVSQVVQVQVPVHLVKIFDAASGASRAVYIPSGTETAAAHELRSLLLAVFNKPPSSTNDIVGFRDDSNVIYSFSALVRFSKQFDNRRLSLISAAYERRMYSGDDSIDDASSTGTGNLAQGSETSLFTEDMAEAAFEIMDLTGDGLLDRDEMRSFLVYTISNATTDGETDARAIADRITDTCFGGMGLQSEVFATPDDFCAWYLSPGTNAARDVLLQIVDAYRGELDSEEEVESNKDEISDDFEEEEGSEVESAGSHRRRRLVRVKSQPNLHTVASNSGAPESATGPDQQLTKGLLDAIDGVNSITGLSLVSVKAVLDALRSQSSYEVPSNETVLNGKKIFVHRSCFLKRLRALAAITSGGHQHRTPSSTNAAIQTQDEVDLVVNYLFDCFSPNQADDTVCLADIACGLISFCGGSHVDNYYAVFQALGEVEEAHSQGVASQLSDAAMSNFLFQMINVMFKVSADVQQQFVNGAEDFAYFVYSHVMDHIARRKDGYWTQSEFARGCAFGVEVTSSLLTQPPLKHYEMAELVKTIAAKHVNKQQQPQSSPSSSNSPRSRRSADDITSVFQEYKGEKIAIVDAKRILGLRNYSPETVLQCLERHSDGVHGYMTLACFQMSVDELLGNHYITLTEYERAIADYLVSMLYNLFRDEDTSTVTEGDGNCDVIKLALAMLLLCGGTLADKAQAVYNVLLRFSEIDIHAEEGIGDNKSNATDEELRFASSPRLDVDYVAMCMEPCLEVILALNPTNNQQNEVTAAGDVAYYLTQLSMTDLDIGQDMPVPIFKQWFMVLFSILESEHVQDIVEGVVFEVFDERDEVDTLKQLVTHIGKLFRQSSVQSQKLEENRLWIDIAAGNSSNSSSSSSSADKKGDSEDADGPLPSTSAVTLELRAIKETFGMTGISADDLMEIFGENMPVLGLTMPYWLQVLSYLMCLANVPMEKYNSAAQLARRLFMVFKLDDVGGEVEDEYVVSYSMFVSGLAAVLSDSPSEEKLMVAFTLLDADGDGLITTDEFELLILSVLKVTVTCSAVAAARFATLPGLSLESLATAVAKECLATLEITSDELLSIEMLCEVANDCMVLSEFAT